MEKFWKNLKKNFSKSHNVTVWKFRKKNIWVILEETVSALLSNICKAIQGKIIKTPLEKTLEKVSRYKSNEILGEIRFGFAE